MRIKNVIITTLLALLIGFGVPFLFLNPTTIEAQSSKPAFRIEFYPCNGGQVQSYIAYSIDGFSGGYVRFKTKDGNEVILNGSWTVIKF